MRVNHSPLLQAAIRIGAAFVVVNFSILRGLLTTSRTSPYCSRPPIDSDHPRRFRMEMGGFAPPSSWAIHKDQQCQFQLLTRMLRSGAFTTPSPFKSAGLLPNEDWPQLLSITAKSADPTIPSPSKSPSRSPPWIIAGI